MRLVVAAAALVVAACRPIPTMDPSQVDVPPAGELTSCEATCAEYDRLGCEEAERTEGGGECEDVCENAASKGWALARDEECMGRAQTCDDARACPKAD